MTEQFILQYAPVRISQLGYRTYHLRYRDLIIEAESMAQIPAYNELFFIVGDPPKVIIESDYGLYDSTDESLPDNVHQHRGEIIISNPTTENTRVKFIQVIIVN